MNPDIYFLLLYLEMARESCHGVRSSQTPLSLSPLCKGAEEPEEGSLVDPHLWPMLCLLTPPLELLVPMSLQTCQLRKARALAPQGMNY